jgi:hypothetical protein
MRQKRARFKNFAAHTPACTRAAPEIGAGMGLGGERVRGFVGVGGEHAATLAVNEKTSAASGYETVSDRAQDSVLLGLDLVGVPVMDGFLFEIWRIGS